MDVRGKIERQEMNCMHNSRALSNVSKFQMPWIKAGTISFKIIMRKKLTPLLNPTGIENPLNCLGKEL